MLKHATINRTHSVDPAGRRSLEQKNGSNEQQDLALTAQTERANANIDQYEPSDISLLRQTARKFYQERHYGSTDVSMQQVGQDCLPAASSVTDQHTGKSSNPSSSHIIMNSATASVRLGLQVNSEPSPPIKSSQSLQTTPRKLHATLNNLLSAHTRQGSSVLVPRKSTSVSQSLLSSPIKSFTGTRDVRGSTRGAHSNHNSSQKNQNATTASAESVIKVFAQSLSQDVEYISVQVNSQTKSSQVIRSLLRKFRLKHRDPNLFYLTLERWIRKDGLKSKNVMLLSDDSCPLQLQQCCSNPPHDDIKFTLQMRAGALVKIHCSDVVPNTRYKCLSLSTQTTVDQTIELMLHCLNLHQSNNDVGVCGSSNSNNRLHLTGSPGSTSTSSNSSSSGIESDFNCNSITSGTLLRGASSISTAPVTHASTGNRSLDSNSRASSVTSISTSSNASYNLSSNLTEQFCLVIECTDTNYRRMLESDEYLADVYHNLLAEAKVQLTDGDSKDLNNNNNSSKTSITHSNSQPLLLQNNKTMSGELVRSISHSDQWFCIKLLRRDEFNHPQQAIKFTNPYHQASYQRNQPPLGDIPRSLAGNYDPIMKHLILTTQIEVNGSRSSTNRLQEQQQMPVSMTGAGGNALNDQKPRPVVAKSDAVDGRPLPPLPPTVDLTNCVQTKQLESESGLNLPPKFILLPPIKPRRRNLSTASSTFGRPFDNNRRRYDPSRLADDLNKLDIYAPVCCPANQNVAMDTHHQRPQ